MKKLFCIGFILLVLFVMLGYLAVNTSYLEVVDNAAIHFVDSIQSNEGVLVFATITNIANVYVILVIGVVFLVTYKHKILRYIPLGSVAIIALITHIIKQAFSRERPNLYLIEKGYSYPSSHTICAIVFYFIILQLMLPLIQKKKIKILFFLSVIALLFLIAFSRLYLGAHYFTDVIGGMLFATSFLCFEECLKKWHMGYKQREDLNNTHKE